MFELFADLIARSVENEIRGEATENALDEERTNAELREQFIAVRAHDLRAPVRAMNCFVDLLLREQLSGRSAEWAQIIHTGAPDVQPDRVPPGSCDQQIGPNTRVAH